MRRIPEFIFFSSRFGKRLQLDVFSPKCWEKIWKLIIENKCLEITFKFSRICFFFSLYICIKKWDGDFIYNYFKIKMGRVAFHWTMKVIKPCSFWNISRIWNFIRISRAGNTKFEVHELLALCLFSYLRIRILLLVRNVLFPLPVARFLFMIIWCADSWEMGRSTLMADLRLFFLSTKKNSKRSSCCLVNIISFANLLPY